MVMNAWIMGLFLCTLGKICAMEPSFPTLTLESASHGGHYRAFLEEMAKKESDHSAKNALLWASQGNFSKALALLQAESLLFKSTLALQKIQENSWEEGLALATLTADKQCPLGMRIMAYASYEGNGCPKDTTKARLLFESLVERGFVMDKLVLGTLYHNGEGGIHDADKGLTYLGDYIEKFGGIL